MAKSDEELRREAAEKQAKADRQKELDHRARVRKAQQDAEKRTSQPLVWRE